MPQNPTDWNPRRIGVIGAGAMGSSLAAIVGNRVPVVMVCRNPDRAAQILRSGVSTTGEIESHCEPIVVRRLSDLAQIGGVSALFVTTKTTAIADVARELKPLLPKISDQPGTPYVVSYQNGIEPARQLVDLIGSERVLRMVLSMGAAMHPSGSHVEITFNTPPHAIGSPIPGHECAADQIASILSEAGLGTQHDEQIELRVWEKAVINAAANPVAALVNSAVGELYKSPARAIADRLLEEGAMVARAAGHALEDDYIAKAHALLSNANDHLPSMVEDIRAGRESEIGQLNCQIIEHAKRLKIPVPTHEIVDALIETFDWKVYRRTHPDEA